MIDLIVAAINAIPDDVRMDDLYFIIRLIAIIFNLRFWEDASVSID